MEFLFIPNGLFDVEIEIVTSYVSWSSLKTTNRSFDARAVNFRAKIRSNIVNFIAELVCFLVLKSGCELSGVFPFVLPLFYLIGKSICFNVLYFTRLWELSNQEIMTSNHSDVISSHNDCSLFDGITSMLILVTSLNGRTSSL